MNLSEAENCMTKTVVGFRQASDLYRLQRNLPTVDAYELCNDSDTVDFTLQKYCTSSKINSNHRITAKRIAKYHYIVCLPPYTIGFRKGIPSRGVRYKVSTSNTIDSVSLISDFKQRVKTYGQKVISPLGGCSQ